MTLLPSRLPHLIFVLGPTASGKSDFAVRVAERARGPRCASAGTIATGDINHDLNGDGINEDHINHDHISHEIHAEIINCDSVQFFSGVDIGAAKPPSALMARVRHHLIGHLPVGSGYTAGDFRRDVLRVLDESRPRGVTRFLLVGGSGFYVQALEKGMFEVPSIAPGVRARLVEQAAQGLLPELHAELRARDPEVAGKIQPADRYRILRALEILRSCPDSSSLTEIRARFAAQRPPAPFRVSKIGLFVKRSSLRERVTRRTHMMIREGLLGEVEKLRESLRALGIERWAPLSSVGYKEAQALLDGVLSRNELESAIVRSTMQLAKRQMTWFKRDPEIRWFDIEEQMEEALHYGVERIRSET